MDLSCGRLRGLDLFSGLGGITQALDTWVRPIAYCDIEKYSRAVLIDRMYAGEIQVAPIWNDVRTLRAQHIPGSIDIICGGFPCQDISIAGNGEGLGGKRSGLFFEIARLASELRPSFLFLENTPALTLRGLDRVLLELTKIGYDSRWTIVSAAEVGAPHLRERIWILAHANSKRRGNESDRFSGSEDSTKPWIHGAENDTDTAGFGRRKGRAESNKRGISDSSGNGSQIHANPMQQGFQRWIDAEEAWEAFTVGSGSGSGSWPQWLPQPAVRRGSDGLRYRNHRIKICGNSVVPQAAQKAFCKLMGLPLPYREDVGNGM